MQGKVTGSSRWLGNKTILRTISLNVPWYAEKKRSSCMAAFLASDTDIFVMSTDQFTQLAELIPVLAAWSGGVDEANG